MIKDLPEALARIAELESLLLEVSNERDSLRIKLAELLEKSGDTDSDREDSSDEIDKGIDEDDSDDDDDDDEATKTTATTTSPRR